MDALGDGNRGRVMEIITGKAPPSHEPRVQFTRNKNKNHRSAHLMAGTFYRAPLVPTQRCCWTFSLSFSLFRRLFLYSLSFLTVLSLTF